MYFLKNDLSNNRRCYRTVTIVMFAVAVLTLCMRLVVRCFVFLPDLAIDAMFSCTVQIAVFLVMPFFAYKLLLGKNFREIAEFSSIKKTKWYYLVIAVALGFFVYMTTIGISAVWQTIIAMLGYTHFPSQTEYPERFQIGIFLFEIFLSAVLPAICEEFLIRGGMLTTMRFSYKYTTFLCIMSVVFGLFHQNITQVFYTACFGLLMAYITVKIGSIFPAMIIHFVNNGLSTYLSYAEHYGFAVGGDFYTALDAMAKSDPKALLASYAIAVFGCFGLVWMLSYLRKKEQLEEERKKVAEFTKTLPPMLRSAVRPQSLYGNRSVFHCADTVRFRPTVRDNAFLYAALAVTVLSTVSTFIWGVL